MAQKLKEKELMLEKQTKPDYEEYTKPKIDLAKLSHNLQNAVKSYCTYCMKEQTITTNGKCRVCGAVLISQKHWKPTIAKIKLIMKHRKDTVPIEINKRIYFVPKIFFQTFKDNEHLGYKVHVMLVEYIRKSCESYSIDRSS